MSERQQGRDITPSISYHDNLAKKWSSFYDTSGFNRRRTFLRERLSTVVHQATRWLDAGCGSGILTQELAKLGATGVALDGSPEMIANAISETADKGVSFEFRHVPTIEHLDEGDVTFDGVLCSSVVEYLSRPEDAFSEFYRVLKPGGTLLVSVPCRYSFVRLTQSLVRRLGIALGRNFFAYLSVSKHEFSQGEIHAKLEEFGFVVDQINEFDPLLPRWLLAIFPGSLLVITAHRPIAS